MRGATRGLRIVSSSGSWLGIKRAPSRSPGEIKVVLLRVDAVREGQGDAGSTPATSTI